MILQLSTWQDWVGFLLGLLGIFINFCIFQQKDHRRMLIFKGTTDFVWGIHYVVLGQWSAVAISVLALVRESIFLWQYKHGKEDKSFLIIFLIAGMLSSWLTWQGPQSLLTGAASAIAVVSYWQTRPKITRILGLIVCVLMILYDLNFIYNIGRPIAEQKPADVSAMIGEIIGMVSAVIGLIRFDKAHRNVQNTLEAK